MNRLHWITHSVLLSTVAVFFWANMDVSQKRYMEREKNEWLGGIRQGFPVCCWDAGKAVRFRITQRGQKLFEQTPYGGLVLKGLLLNFAVLSLSLIMVRNGSEWLVRGAAQRAPKLVPGSSHAA